MKRSKTSKRVVSNRRRDREIKEITPKSEDKSVFKRFINWKTIIGAMIFLGGIGGFFTDFFSPLKEKISETFNPPDYWYCEQDRNVRGLVLSNPKVNIDSILYLQVGINGGVGTRMRVDAIKTNTPYCFIDDYTILPGVKSCTATFKIDESKNVLLSADFYDTQGCLAGKIVDNQFVLNQNCQFTWNRDDLGFEVMDSDFNVVLTVDFQPPNKIAIQGVFFNGDMFLVIRDTQWNGSVKGDIDRLKKYQKELKPIFEYFGKDWFGKRKVY